MKSLYNKLAGELGPMEMIELWEMPLPPKIIYFLWQLMRGRLPSGDQVLNRHGPGDVQCPLCEVAEDMNHIFSFFRAVFFGALFAKSGTMGGALQTSRTHIVPSSLVLGRTGD